jgi:hypothetical protein
MLLWLTRNWRTAMEEEYAALLANRTWQLVPRPQRGNIITGHWVWVHKYRPDGSFERYKARWVVRGFQQHLGVDFGETFAPVIKPATIRTVLTIAANWKWDVSQLDVSNAFLHGHLDEHVLRHQPARFVDPLNPDAVCLLNKSLYGLKQAPRAWFKTFASFAASIGLRQSRSDSSLFIYCSGQDLAYL